MKSISLTYRFRDKGKHFRYIGALIISVMFLHLLAPITSFPENIFITIEISEMEAEESQEGFEKDMDEFIAYENHSFFSAPLIREVQNEVLFSPNINIPSILLPPPKVYLA